jgi:carbamoyl-phosphate synthase large subunit
MKASLTVLFSSAGRRVELMNCFREDARHLGLALRVLAADSDPTMSAACQAADCSYKMPRCTDAAFVPQMLALCQKEKVDLLVPTIDTELLPLARTQAEFAAVGTRVAISDLETVTVARDKQRTAVFLDRHGVPAPRTVPLIELLAGRDDLLFPVILKPVDGSSSIGLREAAHRDDLRDLRVDASRYLAQEKWIGPEYTVNMFFDRNGSCRTAVPHRRWEVRSGEVSKGTTERNPLLEALAVRLARALTGARGALCFQAIVAPTGKVAVFEINARFGGGYPLTHRAGARFSRWLLEEAAGIPASTHNDWQEGLTMLRYDAAVFVPCGKS